MKFKKKSSFDLTKGGRCAILVETMGENMTFENLMPGVWAVVNGVEVMKINPNTFEAKDKNLTSFAVTREGRLMFISGKENVENFKNITKNI